MGLGVVPPFVASSLPMDPFVLDTVAEPIRDSGAIKRRRRVLERSTSVQPRRRKGDVGTTVTRVVYRDQAYLLRSFDASIDSKFPPPTHEQSAFMLARERKPGGGGPLNVPVFEQCNKALTLARGGHVKGVLVLCCSIAGQSNYGRRIGFGRKRASHQALLAREEDRCGV